MMPNKTPEYQINAVKKYLSKFKEVKLRFLPTMGDKSTVAFISRAIQETMERDNEKLNQQVND